MEPEARYTFVGAVVLALIVATVAGYLWLVRGGAGEGYRYYSIHFEKQSLEGLALGSDVNMRGVKVGRVDEYSISRDNINRVDVVVRVDSQTPVSRNTSAVIGRNLVTGIARIDLLTPGTPGPELVEVSPGERYPVIPEGTSDLAEIAGAMSRLAVRGEGALRNVEELLNADNRETLLGTVAAVRHLAEGLDARLERVDVAASGVADTAAALQRAAREITIALERFAGEGTGLVKQLGPLVQQAHAALETMSSAARTLERESTGISGRIASSADSGVLELQATARELRHGAEQLSRAAQGLRDPRSALLGPSPAQLGPGEQLR